jgi:hypothetical protein
MGFTCPVLCITCASETHGTPDDLKPLRLACCVSSIERLAGVFLHNIPAICFHVPRPCGIQDGPLQTITRIKISTYVGNPLPGTPLRVSIAGMREVWILRNGRILIGVAIRLLLNSIMCTFRFLSLRPLRARGFLFLWQCSLLLGCLKSRKILDAAICPIVLFEHGGNYFFSVLVRYADAGPAIPLITNETGPVLALLLQWCS